MEQVLKNHVAILLDVSGSMGSIIKDAEKIFNQQIEFLRKKSLDFDQETRVSVYTFDNDVKCLISDVDVARPMNISLSARGSTAMLDAIGLSIEDLKELPTKYGDHAYILYVLSDGMENASIKHNKHSISKVLSSLGDRWTVAAFAPDNNAIQYLKGYGIPAGNIDKWDTTKQGIEEVGRKFEKTMDNYFASRKVGVRSSQTIFSDLSQVNSKNVSQVLDKIPKNKYKIIINGETKAVEIRDIVNSELGSYVQGNSFYELVKNEHVQPTKEIAIQNKKNSEVYTGSNARQLLGLPNMEVKIVPQDHGEWIVYIQSKSVNRKIIPKQRVLVLK